MKSIKIAKLYYESLSKKRDLELACLERAHPRWNSMLCTRRLFTLVHSGCARLVLADIMCFCRRWWARTVGARLRVVLMA